MFSLLLIFIGVVMMGLALAYIFARMGYNIMKCVCKALYGIMSYVLNHVILKTQLKSDGTLQRYQEEKALKEELDRAYKENRYNEQVREKHDKIVYAVLSKVRDLKAKYPLADEHLFDEYRDSFTSVPMETLRKIEEEIKAQHFERSQYTMLGQYTTRDLDSMTPIESEELKYDTTIIKVSLYQDKNNYIVRVENPENYIDETYVTHKILLAKHVEQMIIAKCKLNYHARRNASGAIFNINDFNNVCGEAVEHVNMYENA